MSKVHLRVALVFIGMISVAVLVYYLLVRFGVFSRSNGDVTRDLSSLNPLYSEQEQIDIFGVPAVEERNNLFVVFEGTDINRVYYSFEGKKEWVFTLPKFDLYCEPEVSRDSKFITFTGPTRGDVEIASLGELVDFGELVVLETTDLNERIVLTGLIAPSSACERLSAL